MHKQLYLILFHLMHMTDFHFAEFTSQNTLRKKILWQNLFRRILISQKIPIRRNSYFAEKLFVEMSFRSKYTFQCNTDSLDLQTFLIL